MYFAFIVRVCAVAAFVSGWLALVGSGWLPSLSSLSSLSSLVHCPVSCTKNPNQTKRNRMKSIDSGWECLSEVQQWSAAAAIREQSENCEAAAASVAHPTSAHTRTDCNTNTPPTFGTSRGNKIRRIECTRRNACGTGATRRNGVRQLQRRAAMRRLARFHFLTRRSLPRRMYMHTKHAEQDGVNQTQKF
jgi:hypothetical protein